MLKSSTHAKKTTYYQANYLLSMQSKGNQNLIHSDKRNIITGLKKNTNFR
jgi:hypothetical protein